MLPLPLLMFRPMAFLLRRWRRPRLSKPIRSREIGQTAGSSGSAAEESESSPYFYDGFSLGGLQPPWMWSDASSTWPCETPWSYSSAVSHVGRSRSNALVGDNNCIRKRPAGFWALLCLPPGEKGPEAGKCLPLQRAWPWHAKGCW